ncbi:MAG: glutamyl-tRNA reductase, partial [Chloroflexi bacterium]|nr:glutamyl-tRNA reductase [Chloroflexota bacterium]
PETRGLTGSTPDTAGAGAVEEPNHQPLLAEQAGAASLTLASSSPRVATGLISDVASREIIRFMQINATPRAATVLTAEAESDSLREHQAGFRPALGFAALGVSHHRAPLAIRERLGRGFSVVGASAPAAGRLGARDGSIALITCNRVELYSVAATAQAAEAQIRGLLHEVWNDPGDGLSPYLDTYTGDEVARHLFRVTSGLDSLVIGEAEVLGQVRRSLHGEDASIRHRPELVHLFHHAVRVGRRARAETGIGRNAGSIASVAINLAQEHFGDLRGRRVLVIGAGEAGKLSARALAKLGGSDLFVANRTPHRAVAVATELGGSAIAWEHVLGCLETVDIVVTATGSPDYVLRLADFERVLKHHPKRRMLALDIAVPRDIEPSVASLPGIRLANVDDLQTTRDLGLGQRREAVGAVEDLIDAEVARFSSWRRSSGSASTVHALRTRSEGLRERELEKALRLLPNLSSPERQVVGALTRSIVTKLLHHPTAALRDTFQDAEDVAIVRRLFGLASESPQETRS